MKKQLRLLFILVLLAHLSVFSRPAGAACRNPNLVLNRNPFFVLAAASGALEVQWFGHAFFQITSSAGTRIITDPFGTMGFPWLKYGPTRLRWAEIPAITTMSPWPKATRLSCIR